MTMPAERARALRWAGEFIRALATAGEISEERKREARVILRHYPSAEEIDLKLAAKNDEDWLAPIYKGRT